MARSIQSRNPSSDGLKECRLSRFELQAHLEALRQRVTSGRIAEADRRRRLYQIGDKVLAESRAMNSPNFVKATASDLRNMTQKYDKYFLGGNCLPVAEHFGIKFRWSKRMTSTGGKTVRTIHSDRTTGKQNTRYEIVLSSALLFQTFSDLQRPIRVTGIRCTNRLQAMQRILEHELIHLVEMLVWDDSCCSEPRFQSIARRLFGHSEHKHDLITQQERAARKFNIRVGSRVQFRHEGKTREGTVNRITRRATVLVSDRNGQLYDDGNRYLKFYVPISHLRPFGVG